jgi:pyridoxine 5-phosphate synthase
MIYLGVNIDHVATIRQARLVEYPSILESAKLCKQGGADSITVHLREDRRHIQDKDVEILIQNLDIKLNLEMAITQEMVDIACNFKPKDCCLVPEKREELTTEGGLEVAGNIERMKQVCLQLKESNITTSLFIDPSKKQIDGAKECGAPVIEIHTGHYANAKNKDKRKEELTKIIEASKYANSLGIQVNAGHGLTLENTKEIAQIPEMVELNIGHSIVARAIFVGLENATKEMKKLMKQSRKQ